MKYLFLFLLFSGLSSCSLFNLSRDIRISLPEFPVVINAADSSYWLVLYRDSRGRLTEKKAWSEASCVELSMVHGEISPVLARAVIVLSDNDQFITKPAGFLYPFNSFSGQTFAWEHGFICSLLLDVSSYLDLDDLNIDRLSMELTSASEGGTMWNLDMEHIKKELIEGDFALYDIRQKRDYEIALNIPQGTWQSDDVLCESFHSSGLADPVLLNATAGISRFCSDKGEILEITVEKNGSFETIVY